jgi:dihydrodipicolinate reductase
MSELKIVVTGASGRMGRTLIREIAQGHGITLCGALGPRPEARPLFHDGRAGLECLSLSPAQKPKSSSCG